MVYRQDVEFTGDGGVTLRGWLPQPDAGGLHPAITMAHGFAGVKEHGLVRFARMFAQAGFAVLVRDHRGFGASEGPPRFDVDPSAQIADWRRARSFLENQPGVNADRIGLWGSSYAGGHGFLLHLASAIAMAIMVIGISLALANLKLIPVSLFPLGKVDRKRVA